LNLPEITWRGDGEPIVLRRTARAIRFTDAVAECEALQSVTSPTRGENMLDLAISYGVTAVTDVRDKVFASDHMAVETTLTMMCGMSPRATRSKVYNYKDADFTGLRRALNLIPWNILNTLDVDSAVDMFYDLVFAAVSDYVPLIELRQKFPPWFDCSVRKLLQEKEKAHKRKKSNPTSENIAAHAQARSDFKRQSDLKYREYLLGLVRDFKDNPKRYWSFIKSLKSSSQISPVLESDGLVFKGDEERATCLNACFARKFCDPRVDALPTPPVFNAPGLDMFTVPQGRIVALLRELSAHKACGPDGLSAKILHECAEELAPPLEIISKISVRTGVFPAVWKKANVIPVFKKGSRKLPENYRPVSLLPICSKILEKVVSESLLHACLPALPASQHGFLPSRSCISNLSCFLDHCWSSIQSGKQTDAIYTDYSSAFTSVNHTLLLHKLRQSFHISGAAHSWLCSYLSDRSQRVVLNGKHSQWTPVQSGVPEGSILGPLLFACYVADIPHHIKTNCIAYADDLKLYHRISNRGDVLELQADLDRLYRWSLRSEKCLYGRRGVHNLHSLR
ncbi:MAG: reverse transcriptase family protein, partial [Amphritea sp.]|nr:reverse transcriptase family protein [Amphritea sp.]